MKRILTIAGSDSGGGAGIQADIKTISLLGGFAMSVVTALTAQNTEGVHAIHELPASFVEDQFDAVVGDIGVDAAKTGMLSSAAIVRAVSRRIDRYSIEKLVVDPVMVAKSGDRLLSEDAEETLRDELLPLAHVVTPNIPEAEVLTGIEVEDEASMEEAAISIHRMGPEYVVVKGGHLKGKPIDILYDGESTTTLVTDRLAGKNTHGTGCTYSSALATFIGKGMEVSEAVAEAKEFVTDAIQHGLDLGRGHGPTNPYVRVAREMERYEVLREVSSAARRLGEMEVGHLVPEVRSNLGYALHYARDTGDVAAIEGRITDVSGRMVACSCADFGVSSHVARIILTVMCHDPKFRAAMNIRYSPDIVSACEGAGLEVASFDRSSEPQRVKGKEGSSLGWGVTQVIERLGRVPDIIYDLGEIGKEPMVRVLGRNPGDIVRKVGVISREIDTGA